jgi:hypothetical protein
MVAGYKVTCPDKALPMPSNIAAWIKRTPYWSLIGSLNYLAITTYPDILFTVSRLASVLDCYRPEHWDAAICVVCYLKHMQLLTLQLGGINPI